jgi:hypothetical protein
MWIAALALSAICVAGLVYALVADWDAEPDKRLDDRSARQVRGGGSGFGLGLGIGIGAGIVLGSLIALRRKSESG